MKGLSRLQANKSACCSSVDASRRYETPVSETEDFITRSPASRVSFMLAWVPLAPQVPQGQDGAKQDGASP